MKVGHDYDIDVAIFDMGFNAPGATDKMTPYDAARLGQTLRPRCSSPDHYDNWVNCAGDPDLIINQFERIVAENTPEIKTVIMPLRGQVRLSQGSGHQALPLPGRQRKLRHQ